MDKCTFCSGGGTTWHRGGICLKCSGDKAPKPWDLHRAVIIKVQEELEKIAALMAMTLDENGLADGPMHSALTGLRARLSFAVEDAGAREYEVLKEIVQIALEAPKPPLFCEVVLLGGEGKKWAQGYNIWRIRLAESLKNPPL